MTNIVQINVSQTLAPAPSQLQATGAMLSQGATTTAQGVRTLITGNNASFTSILKGALAITSLTQSAGTATATTTSPHGIPVGHVLQLTIAGASPAGYNGTFACTATGASTFTFPVSSGLSSPATGTIVYTPEDVAELVAMVTTFFAQGSQQGVYILELGLDDPADGVAYFTTWIAANPGVFYSYLVPRTWDSVAAFLTLLAGFEATTSKTYFFVTTTASNYVNYTALMKCAFVFVEAPGIPSTEFSCAAAWWVTLSYRPSSTNKVTPTRFSFLVGVTAYPIASNGALLQSLQNAGVNVVGPGAEGGISNTLLFYGTTMDGNDFTYWYSVDWAQINVDLAISNEVINGSNNPQNPLYYNQDGINRLQARVASVMATGVADGLVLGQVVQTQLDPTTFAQNLSQGIYNGVTVINAIPFATYTHLNPNDFAIGKYAGMSDAFTANRGFALIVFNINVTQFVAP